ncbi:MAG: hypothetical protein HC921_02330 [Synechococcaceae cyanobacterium SM2_3_1]|nr:hypothetical protein [Synechococcaceae cyanobacterium SM2_3_1]
MACSFPPAERRLLQGTALMAMLALMLLLAWNLLDPLPPAWDEAQHLLLAQQYGDLWQRWQLSDDWWRQWVFLSQRYPPLTYWLSLVISSWSTFDRAGGQLINLLLLGILAGVTQRLGAVGWNPTVGWLAAGLLLLYPGITGISHVYMTDLTLCVGVALAFWASLVYWTQPSGLPALMLGISLGLVLLAKWNGVLFLVFPLGALLLRGLIQKRWRVLLHLGLTGITAFLICFPWYGPNWLFVISNGFNYAATTHYYITCATGSWCWWTTYLRWLPLQMSWGLCLLPLLSLIPLPPSGIRNWRHHIPCGSVGLAVGLTYVSGYLIYTLIGIKDPRFTLPLLPLLAVLSAVGIQHLWRQWWHPFKLGWVLLMLAFMALIQASQPLTPGASSLGEAISQQTRGYHPQRDLQQWLATLTEAESWLRSTVGVIPNLPLLSSETLTYLARIQSLPLVFVPAGQVTSAEQQERLQLEFNLLDQFLHHSGEDLGKVGPYGPAKSFILESLQTSDLWTVSSETPVSVLGRLQVFRRQHPPIQVEMADPQSEVTLESIQLVQGCEILTQSCEQASPWFWQLEWQGSSTDLANTVVWLEVETPTGDLEGQADHLLASGQLRSPQVSPLKVTEWLDGTLDLPAGSHVIQIRWQSDPNQPLRTERIKVQIPDALHAGVSLLPQPNAPLQRMAAAAEQGDLDQLSSHLSLWTTLRHTPVLLDPQLDLTVRLLSQRLQEAEADQLLNDQISLHYQLAMIAVARMDASTAQDHFLTLTQIQPENHWNPAFLAFLRLLFTHEVQDLGQELQSLLYPFVERGELCAAKDSSDHCELLRRWQLIPSATTP